MNLNQIFKFNCNVNSQFLSRKIHNYATIYESINAKLDGKSTKIQGWVKAVRSLKHKIFLDVNDGTASESLQLILDKKNKPTNLSYGCSIIAEGHINKNPNGKSELLVKNITVIGECPLEGYPFYPNKSYDSEYVRKNLHFRPRTKIFSSTLRLRDLAMNLFRDYFRNQNFININTPILTTNDCEGAGEMFNVHSSFTEIPKQDEKTSINDEASQFFDKKIFLSVSGQLQLEACARSLSKVYAFSPTFRAENSKSRLHLSEFYMIEAEIAFMSSLKDLANEIQFLIKAVTTHLFEKAISDLKIVKAPDPIWFDKVFGYITYDEALHILDKHSDRLSVPLKPGENLGKEHELFLVKHHGDVPIFVTEWPKNLKAFYMKECMHDSSKVEALDLLVPTVGELVGGSVREDDYLKLQSKIPPNANLDWYLELRKYGNISTSGFGVGFERYLQFVLGIQNIKDVIPFPRYRQNCSC